VAAKVAGSAAKDERVLKPITWAGATTLAKCRSGTRPMIAAVGYNNSVITTIRPQPMMMMPHPHPQAMGYAAAPPFGGYPPQGFSGGVPGRNQGGAAAPIPFSRPSYQEQQQRRQQQQQQGYYRQPPESSSPSLSPPYLAGSKAPSGRNKVDSASSLDQHAQQLKNLSLE